MASRPAAAAALAGLCVAAAGCALLAALSVTTGMLAAIAALTAAGFVVGGIGGARWISSTTPRREWERRSRD